MANQTNITISSVKGWGLTRTLDASAGWVDLGSINNVVPGSMTAEPMSTETTLGGHLAVSDVWDITVTFKYVPILMLNQLNSYYNVNAQDILLRYYGLHSYDPIPQYYQAPAVMARWPIVQNIGAAYAEGVTLSFTRVLYYLPGGASNPVYP